MNDNDRDMKQGDIQDEYGPGEHHHEHGEHRHEHGEHYHEHGEHYHEHGEHYHEHGEHYHEHGEHRHSHHHHHHSHSRRKRALIIKICAVIFALAVLSVVVILMILDDRKQPTSSLFGETSNSSGGTVSDTSEPDGIGEDIGKGPVTEKQTGTDTDNEDVDEFVTLYVTDDFDFDYCVTVYPKGGGSVTVSQTDTEPSEQTLKACPAPGYIFRVWSDGVSAATRAIATDSNMDELVAYFTKLPSDGRIDALYLTFPEKSLEQTDDTGVSIQVVSGITGTVDEQVDGHIKLRGNASRGFPKKSYTLFFDTPVSFLGLGNGSARKWVLISNHCDKSLLRNYLSLKLQRQLDGIPWSPDCVLVDVYVNGEYRGNYLLAEKITSSHSRLDLSLPDDVSDLSPDDPGDFIVEMDVYASKSGVEGVDWFNVKGISYVIHGDDIRSEERCKAIASVIEQAYSVFYSGKYRDACSLIDMDSVIDSYILAEVTKNIDCGWSSFYIYRKNGVLYMGPSWDFDLAMGNDYRLDNGDYKNLYAGKSNGFTQQNKWFLKMMNFDGFASDVNARMAELKANGVFDDWIALLDTASQVYGPSFEHNFERWPVLSTRINMEPDVLYKANLSSREQVAYLRAWIVNRLAWLDNEFGIQ